MKKNKILALSALTSIMLVSIQANAWTPSVMLAVENESEYDDSNLVKHRSGTALTTPIVGAYLEEGKFMYDASFAQSYTSAKQAYKKNQNNIGIKYSDSYLTPWGATGDYSFRFAYRGENIHSNPASLGAYSSTWNKGDLRSNEQRNEWWFVPYANYKFNNNFRVHGTYTYRLIDRQMTFYKTIDQGAAISPTTRSTESSIQSGYAGFRYTFDSGVSDFSRNFLEANYYFVKEDLKGTLYNDEQFIWMRGYMPYRLKGYIGGVSPYVYWAFKDAERRYYFSNGALGRIEDASRPRYGVRISQNMTNNWALALDTYYSPRKMQTKYASPSNCVSGICQSNPDWKVGDNNDHTYVYAYLELIKRF